jgi:hypothetical protein
VLPVISADPWVIGCALTGFDSTSPSSTIASSEPASVVSLLSWAILVVTSPKVLAPDPLKLTFTAYANWPCGICALALVTEVPSSIDGPSRKRSPDLSHASNGWLGRSTWPGEWPSGLQSKDESRSSQIAGAEVAAPLNWETHAYGSGRSSIRTRGSGWGVRSRA